MMKENSINESYKRKSNALKMWIFTIVSVFYFMIPFKVDGKTQMCISYLEGLLTTYIEPLPLLITIFLGCTAICSVLFSTVMKGKLENAFLKSVFETGVTGIIFRILGVIILVMSYFKIGPEYIWSEFTGGLMTFDLIPMLFCLFLLALTVISFLTDFGALELLGGTLKPLFKPLFRLSGKAAVLSIVSYIGSGTTGMIVTDGAHKRNEFTTREANIIVLGFAIVSFPVTFAYPTGIAGLDVQYFPALALCLVACTIVCTMIIARVPPISRKPNTYYNGEPAKPEEKRSDQNMLVSAYEDALKKADAAPKITVLLKKGFQEFISFVIQIFPMIIVIATAVLVLSEYTPVFEYMAKPLAPVFHAAGLPEADQAAPAFVLGFADIFLPFITAIGITSQYTKFVICVVAIMQMYCASEGIVVLLKSSMKIKLSDLIIVFIMRTIISIPIAILFAKLFGIA